MALGGYFGSRLMTNIREDKGYTYGISSALLGNWEGGVITISTQCDNNYSMAVIDEIKKEVSNLKKNDFCTDELNRLKRFAMTQIAGILDSPFTIMDYYENQRHVLTSVDYYNQMQQSINLLTSQRISELADKYLDINEFRISIAGNPNNKV
jgi:predicted Zn-dependent peptidase